ncbi:ankyrin repeat domain-containing protein [Paraburkholderia sp. SIMBA_055]
MASDAALMQAVITAPQRPAEADARPLLRRSRDSPTPDHMRQAPLSLGRQFEMAAIEGDVGGMRDLLAVGVKLDLNATLHFGRSVGYCALYHAVSSSHVAATRHLIGLGVELPDDEQWVTDALCNAAKDGDLGLVRLLVSAGADFSAVGSDGMTALDHAVRKSHMDLVAFLGAPSRAP